MLLANDGMRISVCVCVVLIVYVVMVGDGVRVALGASGIPPCSELDSDMSFEEGSLCSRLRILTLKMPLILEPEAGL